MTTLPLATIRPAICDGSGPVTRLSVTALALGCANCTVCWLPTSKLCHSIAARWLDWLTVVCAVVCPIDAVPATTCPPEGRAVGDNWAEAGVANSSGVAACSAVPTSRAERRRAEPAIDRFGASQAIDAFGAPFGRTADRQSKQTAG
jgi:hypothetical protein